MTTAIRVLKVVDEKRTLIVELPDDTPLGLAEVSISVEPLDAMDSPDSGKPVSERDVVRARMRAAGFLAETQGPPAGSTLIEDADLARIGRLPPGARPSDELIDEDREQSIANALDM